jgi:hypothetical protein
MFPVGETAPIKIVSELCTWVSETYTTACFSQTACREKKNVNTKEVPLEVSNFQWRCPKTYTTSRFSQRRVVGKMIKNTEIPSLFQFISTEE